MAGFNKFQVTVGDLGTKKLDLNGDTLVLILTNTSPNAADVKYDTTTSPPQLSSTSNAQELASSGGYTQATSVGTHSYTQTSGTGTLSVSANLVFTATSGFGPFRYATLCDTTAGTTATRSVIGWWDYGSSISLLAGETLTWAPSGLNVLTLA